MRHLCVYKLLQLLMFIREFRDMSLYGHRPASLLKGREIKSLIAAFVTPSLLSKDCEALTGLPGERAPGLFESRLAKPSPHLTTPVTTRAPEELRGERCDDRRRGTSPARQAGAASARARRSRRRDRGHDRVFDLRSTSAHEVEKAQATAQGPDRSHRRFLAPGHHGLDLAGLSVFARTSLGLPVSWRYSAS